MSDDRKADEEEPVALEEWGVAWRAPASLRESTLQAARKRGLVGGRTVNRTRWIAAAATVVIFTAGYAIGSQLAPGMRGPKEATNVSQTGTSPAAGPLYALFLFEDDTYQSPSADDLQARIREYSTWARSLGESGRYVTGEKLGDGGTFCRVRNGALDASGSPMHDASRGVLAGYFIVGAANLEEALSVARGCPHLKYGGSVEVRPIETT